MLDSGSGHLLRISPAGLVGVEINRSEILALTGGFEVLYENKGIAIDAAGALYVAVFTSSSPGGFFGGDTSILKKTPEGVLSILTSQTDLSAATGNSDADAEGITFGSDGFLYAIDDSSNALLRVDSLTGKVSVFVDSAAFESLAGLTSRGYAIRESSEQYQDDPTFRGDSAFPVSSRQSLGSLWGPLTSIS